MLAIPLSTVVGGPLAGFILELQGAQGLAGWQWLFLLEGIPAVLLGFVVLVYLTDTPEQAKWLTPEQGRWLSALVKAEHRAAEERHGVGLKQALVHPTVWLLALILFAGQTASYGLTLWIPQIVKSLSGLPTFEVSMISALPYVAASIGMILIGASSDRSGERLMHVAIPTALGGLGFAAPAVLNALLGLWVALGLVWCAWVEAGALGTAMRLVRDNPLRAQSLGLTPRRVRARAMFCAGLAAGVAGALFALVFEVATPEAFATQRSLGWMMAVLIGGVGASWGAAWGAGVHVLFAVALSLQWPAWQLGYGLLFVVVMLARPDGLASRRGSAA